MFFCERELRDNHILKKPVRVKWQDDFFTDSCLTWYASKKELRLTRFGRSFSLLQAKYTGALFVLAKESDVDYAAFLFDTEDAIQQYLDAFGLTPAETNCLVQSNAASLELQEDAAIAQFISHLTMDFPSSYEMARAAREIIAQNQPFHVTKNPDQSLLDWIQMEYRLFRTIEHDRYGGIVTAGFSTVDDFLTLANKILNRRKSRTLFFLPQRSTTTFRFRPKNSARLLQKPPAKTAGGKCTMRPTAFAASRNTSAHSSKAFRPHKWMKCRRNASCLSCRNRISRRFHEPGRIEYGPSINSFLT